MPKRLMTVTGLVVCSAAAVLAHDEDWRKYADMEPPVEGPIWRAGADGDLGRSSVFDSSGLQLLSQVPTNNIGTGGNAADCWGYTSPSGREYALIGVRTGTGVIEVTDPTNPVVVGFISSAQSMWHDVKVLGEYAYSVNESGNGIQVIDLSNVDNGVVSLVQNKMQNGHSTTHNIAVNEETGYLYLAGANVLNGGLIAVDTTNPANPTFAGAWTNSYVHDVQVVNMEVGPFAGREIAFCFNGGSGIEIIDVTDKNDMVKIGGTGYSGLRYTHQGWISEDQQWLYVNDELDEGQTVSLTTTRVFRIHDPAWDGPPSTAPSLTNPVYEGKFTTGLSAIDHNLYIKGNLIFQANYRSGLRIFDTSLDPSNPQEVGFIDTYPGSDSASFNGAWSVYPYFASGNVIVSDIERGLFVVRPDQLDAVSGLAIEVTNKVPAVVGPNETVPVVIEADEVNTTVDSQGYRVRVGVNGDPFFDVPMSPTGVAGEFAAELSGFDCLDKVTFRVVGNDQSGELFFSDERSFTIADSEEILATGENPTVPFTTNATASAGAWDFGAPVNAGRGDPPTDSDGTDQAWLTQNSLGPIGDGNSDVDSGTVSLTTERYDVSGGAEIRYDYWLNDIANGPLSADDYFRVEASVDGQSFVLVREYLEAASVWRSDTITFGPGGDLPATDDVRLRFTVSDLGDQNVVEGGVDAITVAAFACDPSADPCPGDVDGDNSVGLPDLLAVLSAFGDTTAGGASAGDLDGDGSVGLPDLLTVLGAFGSGC